MKNKQKLYYSHYYNQDLDGKCVPVSRKECFAPATLPTADNPYPQRWFYDYEAGYVIRLARNKAGDDLGKRNAADLKSEVELGNGGPDASGKARKIATKIAPNATASIRAVRSSWIRTGITTPIVIRKAVSTSPTRPPTSLPVMRMGSGLQPYYPHLAI
jgi:hypothetical protein